MDTVLDGGGPQALGPGDRTGAGPRGTVDGVVDSAVFGDSVALLQIESSTFGVPGPVPLPLPRPPLLPVARELPRPVAAAVATELDGTVLLGVGSLVVALPIDEVGEVAASLATF